MDLELKKVLAAVRARLKQLPHTAESVATFLLEQGCLGEPGCPRNCPLYHYLRSAVPDNIDLRIEGGFAWLCRRMDLNAVPQRVCLTNSCNHFVFCFDEREYPALQLP